VDNTTKPLSRLLLLTILICGLSFQVSYVSGASEPSVPEFTVELVAYPYDVSPVTTTKIDEYTGEETVKTTPGYHVKNRSIEIVITNQPFTPYVDADGHEINLYYNVRTKGHFGDEWEELYSRSNASSSANPVPSSSEYTVLAIPADYPDDAQVDFQVEALAGYYKYWADERVWFIFGYTLTPVEASGWSNTQTITISEENVQIRLNEEIPEFPSWTILPLTLTVALVVAVYKRKLTEHSSY
jgi:hypothetical protein